MKHFLVLVSIVCFTLVGKAQQEAFPGHKGVAQDLKAKVVGNNLQLSWGSTAGDLINYWEVQGSKDGKNFSTLGLVLGADPVSTTTKFKFKQESKKIMPGMKYYRVLRVENETTAIASNMILLSK